MPLAYRVALSMLFGSPQDELPESAQGRVDFGFSATMSGYGGIPDVRAFDFPRAPPQKPFRAY
jgi:hypothetical protein